MRLRRIPELLTEYVAVSTVPSRDVRIVFQTEGLALMSAQQLRSLSFPQFMEKEGKLYANKWLFSSLWRLVKNNQVTRLLKEVQRDVEVAEKENISHF